MGRWAKMTPLRGEEALRHNLLHKRQLWQVILRFHPDINEECKATYGTEALAITACEDPDGCRKWLVLTCETGVPA